MKAALLGVLPALFLLAGCPQDHGEDPAPTTDAGPDAAAPAWSVVAENLDGALLSVWGPSSADIWSVGGAIGNGGPPLVVRWDGAKLTTMPTTGTETYWWVHGTSATDVWLVGEKGRITHWNGAALEEKTSGTTATLFGVMAFSASDAWAVGGTPDDPSAPNDVVLHWDGAAWKPETVPAPTTPGALFKVWGTSSDDLWVVGDAGVVLHRKAGTWTREAEGLAKGRLTTVAGCSASEVYAVGGRDLLAYDGTRWRREDTPLLNDVNGVACAPASVRDRPGQTRVVVVGGGSLKLRRVDGAWSSDFGTVPYDDLHGAFVDDTGALWGAGGAFTAASRPGAKRSGVLARYR